MAPHGMQQPPPPPQHQQQPRRRQRAADPSSSSGGGGDAGGQQGVRKRPRPDHQPPVGTEDGEPHFVYTLFPGTASLEAFLTL